jgi:para-nitrobenzyl esterase
VNRAARIAFLLVLAAVRLAAAQATEPVPLDAGRITGTVEDGVRVFKGIPYAAPPVGDLRWKPPQTVEPWDGARACTAFGPACPQPDRARIAGAVWREDEDCLYLNVWAPTDVADKLPVMVWIHGGGFTIGAGSVPIYDGAALARQGVVLVTINYRLGPLGFLAHPLLSQESEHGVSGNYGLLDMIAALRWVRANIAAFGGDPERVTLFGESAGSVAVCRLMVSPLAKGLFHRAIAQSGGAHGRNRPLRQARRATEPMEHVGERLARILGCGEADDPLAALRAKSPKELLEAAKPAVGLFGRGIKFGPVVDGYVLPDAPDALFAAGKQHDVPFIAGSNADEGTMFLGQLTIRRPLGYRWLIRRRFGRHADEILALFPAETPADLRGAMNKLTTVSAFVAPARALVRAVEAKPAKAWLYHFTRVPPIGAARRLGAFHGLEIAYVFRNLRQGAGWAEWDKTLSERMSARWVQFARTGDPNAEGLADWPAYTTEADPHLEFGDAIEVNRGLYRQACDLFDRIWEEKKQ